VERVTIDWHSLNSKRAGQVIFPPPSSRRKAWTKQLSSCKAIQYGEVLSTGSIYKTRAATPSSARQELLKAFRDNGVTVVIMETLSIDSIK